MPALENLSPLAVCDLLTMTTDGREALLVVAAGTYRLPPPGPPSTAPLALADEQPPPPLEDEYWGAPGESSLRMEGQTAPVRPGTDVYVTGHAHAPAGRAVPAVRVRVRVGPCDQAALVLGDREWAGGGGRATEPEPFHAMPLVWERAFGGASETKPGTFEPRNPVGVGCYASRSEADGQLLPNIEAFADQISECTDRPDPVGFGPIARHWAPRAGFAGTYDQDWADTRAPLWPDDFDPRFFHAAAPGLSTPTPLVGGETVTLEGLHPDGPLAFFLPRRRLLVKAAFRAGVDRRLMTLDAVWLRPDDGEVTMIWRATVPAHGQLLQHRLTTVRALSDWEDVDAEPGGDGAAGAPATFRR